MKKLSIEEKAKRYDEAIKKAKSKIKNDKDHVLYEDDVIEMFPELKESEDERIRKELIKLMKQMSDTIVENYTTVPISDFVAWLEKQGEQNPAEWHREDEQNLNACLGYIPDEPKFKIGDWLVHNERRNIIKIVNATPLVYEVVNVLGYHYTITDTAIENNYHLWSIADAKDGDVLAYNDGSLTIFRYRLSGLNAGLYMSYVLLTDKIEFKQTCAISNSHPATKEQRDLLFQKMKEAGYEWDADKKELRKIKQHAWNEEDDGMLHGIIAFISTTGCIVEGFETWIDWLKSLKDRVQPQPKQEWNEEDEKMFKDIVTRLFSHPDVDKTEYDKSYHWLKSLRPQNTL